MNFMEYGTVHVEAMVIRSLWDNLVSGKNSDQLRLGEARGGRRDAKQTISKEVAERATAASVQIRQNPGKKGWSGTIVTKDGLIATCAHHFVMPGAQVVVSLPDGRDVPAEVQGLSFPSDVGLVRITEQGQFPFVGMGDSTQVLAGDSGLAVGYGPVNPEARQPRVQTVSVNEPSEESSFLELFTSFKMVAGDSGGGLFDCEGRLVGIHCGIVPFVTHRRVELFHKHWDELRSTFKASSISDLVAIESEIQQAAAKSQNSIVEVLDGDTVSALGVIVSTDGKIVTKASLLPNRPQCRLPDGRVLPARVLKSAKQYDLALLQVESDDLRAIVISKTADSPVGLLVAAVTGSEQPAIGCIAHPPVSMPPERGQLQATLRDSDRGLEVTELDTMRAIGGLQQQLQKGDIIVSIDGHPTPNHESYLGLLATEKGNPIAIAGDQVRLVVRRVEKQIELIQTLGPPDRFRMAEQSARCSGFSQVRSITTTVAGPKHCGGPVFDRRGRLSGLVIAWRNSGWAIVLPVEAIEAVATEG
jgi:serine protease Do